MAGLRGGQGGGAIKAAPLGQGGLGGEDGFVIGTERRREAENAAKRYGPQTETAAAEIPSSPVENVIRTGTANLSYAPSQQNIDNAANSAYTDLANTNGSEVSTNVPGTGITEDRSGVSGIYGGRNADNQRGRGLDGSPVNSGLGLLSGESVSKLQQSGVYAEMQESTADNAAFSSALDAARAADTQHGWAVTPKSVEDLESSGAKTYMSADGSSGYAVAPDGDIEAVFANKQAGAPKGVSRSLIPQAVAAGGTKLDCYGPALARLYSKHGFIPVARVQFNPEYANPGWDASKGTPDIYFMMYTGGDADSAVSNYGTYPVLTQEQLDALPVMEYDEAYAYRDGLLASRQAGAANTATQTDGNPVLSTAQEAEEAASDALNTGESGKPHMSMEDFRNSDSSVWTNVDYDDVETQNRLSQETHDRMVAEGRVVEISEEVLNETAESYPDLRTMKKKDRAPIFKAKAAQLRGTLRSFLSGLKKGSFEFEVNGNILEARLYDAGIEEVLTRITQQKANMLRGSEDIFKNCEYLYSTPDGEGNPNIYRWNYFYCPVKIGSDTVGVRIAVRDMVTPEESQIYNWDIKKDATLAPGRHLPKTGRPSTHSSSDASDLGDSSPDATVPQAAPGVNSESAGGDNGGSGPTVTTDERGYTGPKVETQDRVFETNLSEEEKQMPGLTAEEAMHVRHSDEEVDRRAKARLENPELARAELLDAESWTDEDTATAGYLIQSELEAADNAKTDAERQAIYERLAKLKEQWNKQGTEEGRALRQRKRFVAEEAVAEAAKILFGKPEEGQKTLRSKLSPQGKTNIMRQVQTLANEFNSIQPGDADGLIGLIKKLSDTRKTTGRGTTRAMRTALDYALNQVAQQDGVLDFLREVATTQIKSVASDYLNPGIINKVNSWRFMSMLSNMAMCL